jgi:hypothetical protein
MRDCVRPVEFRFDVPNDNVNEPFVNVDMSFGLDHQPNFSTLTGDRPLSEGQMGRNVIR